MPGFDDVISAWQEAPVEAIHPLRAVDLDAYWQSGRYQAAEAAEWIDPGATVVDFGCGDGRVALALAEHGFDVIAVDASPSMLTRLRANAKKRGVTLRTSTSDGSDLLRKIKKPADAIVCRAVLIHHSHADVTRLVGQFSEALKPGGRLIADWPLAQGREHSRRDWIDVTTWTAEHRHEVAHAAGLRLLSGEGGNPGVWERLG